MTLLQDKVAIVTGASRGIGRAIAIELASQGAIAVVNYASSSAGSCYRNYRSRRSGDRYPS